MIYQFKDGPLDGEEKHVPDMPLGAIFRYPMPPEIEVKATPTLYPFGKPLEARYRVTDIGEMTFDHYEG